MLREDRNDVVDSDIDGCRLHCAGLRLHSAGAQAQDYPDRPVTLVAPTAPGGVIDRICRILAQRFSEAWGRQFVVEHRPGANNQLAAEYITKAPPDGYTLMVSPEVTFAVNPSLYKRLPYDPFKGFTPIAGLVIINHGADPAPVVAGRERQGSGRARQEKAGLRSTTAPSAPARPAT